MLLYFVKVGIMGGVNTVEILLCRILMSAAPEIGHKNISLQTEYSARCCVSRTRDFKELREF